MTNGLFGAALGISICLTTLTLTKIFKRVVCFKRLPYATNDGLLEKYRLLLQFDKLVILVSQSKLLDPIDKITSFSKMTSKSGIELLWYLRGFSTAYKTVKSGFNVKIIFKWYKYIISMQLN